jgi:ankyrin repeat protein
MIHNVTCYLRRFLSEPDKVTGVTPIMVAVQREHTASIQELIARRVKLANKDNKGNTVFHYTVNCTNQHIIQVNFDMHQQS